MKFIRYVVGIIGFLLVWFVVAVVVGFIVTFFNPPAPGHTVRLGIGFDWRNLPGVILGLLAGIQSFRASVRQPKMKDGKSGGDRRAIRHIIVAHVCVILLFIGGCTISTFSLFRSFDNLEQNAKQVITGPELQAWATNLLARYSITNMDVSVGRSNCPIQLRGLCPRLGPNVVVYKDDGRPPSVRIWWGSGFMGAAGFEVGGTNFDRPGHKWQDGVYFFSND
jgi:hypothetical protein